MKQITHEILPILCTAVVLLSVYYGLMRRGSASNHEHIEVAKRSVRDFEAVRIGGTPHVPSVFGRTTFIVISSPDCVFCTESAPFHRTLLSEASTRSIPVVLSVPNSKRDMDYVRSLGLERAMVVDWVSLQIRPQGTPSILLLSSRERSNACGWDGLTKRRKAKCSE